MVFFISFTQRKPQKNPKKHIVLITMHRVSDTYVQVVNNMLSTRGKCATEVLLYVIHHIRQ